MYRDDELMHYGVLGMKWGQRRARKNYEQADRLSRKAARTRNTQKAAAYRSEADARRKEARNTEQYHTKMAGGKKAYEYTKNQSMGKTLAKSYLLGTYGAMKYNQARSRGEDRSRAAAKGVGYAFGNAGTLGGLSVVEPRIKKEDRDLARAAGNKVANTARRKIKNRVR